MSHSTFDPSQLSFFSWLGVTYYLPKEAVLTSLRKIRAIVSSGSNIVFDYMDADSFPPEKVARRMVLMHARARLVGEPMKSGFNPLTVASKLRYLGFDLRENLGPAELDVRYFQNRADLLHAFEHGALIVLLIVAYPLGDAIWLSLTNARIGSAGKFVGLANYLSLLGNNTFWRTVSNTLTYTLIGMGVKLGLGLVMALALNRITIGRNIVSGILLFPWIVPTVVSTLVWKWMFNSSAIGIINYVLLNLHLVDRPVAWLGTGGLAMASVITISVWREIPFFGVSLLAGLQGISREQYEASSLDGASSIQQFWHVTIPNLRGIILLISVLSAVMTAYDFTIIWALTQGGPVGATHLFSTFSFEQAFNVGELAKAVAISLIAFPVIAPIVLWIARIMERQESQ